MTPFAPADPIPDPEFTPEAVAERYGVTLEYAKIAVAKALSAPNLFLNDQYQVAYYRDDTPAIRATFGCAVIHLSIRRLDREPLHDWRDLQQIKNLLVGPENEAIEIYPAESRLVDTANQYHLWVFEDKQIRIPLGFNQRLVDDRPLGRARNRPFNQGEKA